MTGMSARDRIPLLERELLRIQNELAVARVEAMRVSELDRIVVALAWCDSVAGADLGVHRQGCRERLQKKLDELLGGD